MWGPLTSPYVLCCSTAGSSYYWRFPLECPQGAGRHTAFPTPAHSPVLLPVAAGPSGLSLSHLTVCLLGCSSCSFTLTAHWNHLNSSPDLSFPDISGFLAGMFVFFSFPYSWSTYYLQKSVNHSLPEVPQNASQAQLKTRLPNPHPFHHAPSLCLLCSSSNSFPADALPWSFLPHTFL